MKLTWILESCEETKLNLYHVVSLILADMYFFRIDILSTKGNLLIDLRLNPRWGVGYSILWLDMKWNWIEDSLRIRNSLITCLRVCDIKWDTCKLVSTICLEHLSSHSAAKHMVCCTMYHGVLFIQLHWVPLSMKPVITSNRLQWADFFASKSLTLVLKSVHSLNFLNLHLFTCIQ